jgi:hypothetical protein
MKKVVLALILGGLILAGTGCGGGGGSSNGGESEPDVLTTTKTIDMNKNGNIELNLRYTVATATGSSNTVTMTIPSIDIQNGIIVVNCTWKATNRNGCAKIVKLSDKGTKTFYMYDNTHDTTTDNQKGVYYHRAGTGAAYTETTLSTTTVEGSYTFPTLNRGVTSIYFYDWTYSRTFGPIAVTGTGL